MAITALIFVLANEEVGIFIKNYIISYNSIKLIKIMKVFELKQVINEVIKESLFDFETTEFSRQIINIIKKAMVDDTKDMYFAKSSRNDIHPIRVDIHYRDEDTPLAIKGEYQRGYRDIVVGVLMTRGKDYSKELAGILPRVKEVIRHELEHYRQDVKGSEDFSNYYGSPDLTKINPYTNPLGYMDRLEDYYLHPSEVKAYAVGLYKKSLINKRMFRDELAELQNTIKADLTNKKIPIEMIQRLIDKLRKEVYQYARSRFPKADPLVYLGRKKFDPKEYSKKK
jgi:hypothetical protein